MKRYLIIGALLVALTAHASANKSPQEIAEMATRAVVYITCRTGNAENDFVQGTGFMYEDGDIEAIVTNAHVVKGAVGIKIETQEGTAVEFTGYCGFDTDIDIAVLSFKWGDADRNSHEPLLLADYSWPMIGQHIYVAGHPAGLNFTFSDGMVSSIYRDDQKIQFTAPVSPGSSGSPVMDEAGRVIGVAVSILAKGENLNFAVPASLIKSSMHPGASCPLTFDFRKDTQSKPKVGIEAGDAEQLAAIKFAYKFITTTQADGKPFNYRAWLADPLYSWYGHKDYTIAQVERDTLNYYKRWPRQTTLIEDHSMTARKIKGNYVAYDVSMTCRWTATNKNERRSGVVRTTVFVFRYNDGTWKVGGIEAEKLSN
jgi:S1-C subfamily serine protease